MRYSGHVCLKAAIMAHAPSTINTAITDSEANPNIYFPIRITEKTITDNVKKILYFNSVQSNIPEACTRIIIAEILCVLPVKITSFSRI